ncbi:hypothetical protein LC609_19370 [Nostoc sp. XA013]|nr:hypothetical protein [Nostoc sp. XA013]
MQSTQWRTESVITVHSKRDSPYGFSPGPEHKHFRPQCVIAPRAIASHSLDRGAPVQLIQQTLGHTSGSKLR